MSLARPCAVPSSSAWSDCGSVCHFLHYGRGGDPCPLTEIVEVAPRALIPGDILSEGTVGLWQPYHMSRIGTFRSLTCCAGALLFKPDTDSWARKEQSVYSHDQRCSSALETGFAHYTPQHGKDLVEGGLAVQFATYGVMLCSQIGMAYGRTHCHCG